jgi:acid phosphatase
MATDANHGFPGSAYNWHQDCALCRGCIVGLCLALAGCRSAPALQEPLNLSQAKEAVSRYCDSGDYARDISSVAMQALAWVEERAAKRKNGEHLAIVLDLDETVLSNEPLIRRLDYAFIPAEWDAWLKKAELPAIEPIRAVYRRARELGIDVLFVTGRREAGYRACTEENLRRAGMGDYARLLMGTDKGPQRSNAETKTAQRAALEKEGFVIVANVGDQESDLAGGHAERSFKVPDPFYFMP